MNNHATFFILSPVARRLMVVVGSIRMHKYKITFRLIYAYYILTLIVGAGQIYWAFKYGWEFKSPEVDGFYMLTRFMLALFIIAFVITKKRRLFFWTAIIESAINIFVVLFQLYYMIWYLVLSIEKDIFFKTRKIVSIYWVWDLSLFIIPVLILYFLISRWNEVTIQPVNPPDAA